jgi:hypothetical protein
MSDRNHTGLDGIPPGALSKVERAQFVNGTSDVRAALLIKAKQRVAVFESEAFPFSGHRHVFCHWCGEPFEPRRASARYCSEGHKVQARLATKRASTPWARRRRSKWVR